jgi:hypothetical protein
MRIVARGLLAAAVVVLSATVILAESVTVEGSSTEYPTQIETKIGDKTVKMDLTGAGLRKRVVFKVYTIGSYIEASAGAKSAEDLISADCRKQFHLVMERDVDGKEMAEAVEKAIHKSCGEDAFAKELKALADTMKELELKKGDNIRLSNIPKKGLECDVAGKKTVSINNSDFSKAIWEIYLGKKCVDDKVKDALVSRLSAAKE